MRKKLRFIKYFIFSIISIFKKLFERFRTHNKIKMVLEKSVQIKLEIGAGTKKGSNGWTTLDYNNACDLFWDLRRGIPFPANSVDMIYSSHLFEHLTFKEIEVLLQECKRVLKPNGIFSICVPNARFYIDAYMRNEQKFFFPSSSFYQLAINNTTSIDIINFIAYMDGEHKYMFDQDNLICILQNNGFKNVKIRDFDCTVDLQARDFESIYAIANK